MKLSKRLLSMLLVIAFCLTSFAVAPVSAAFTDLPEEHNAYDAVNVLSKLGVINGYEENGSFNFKPENNVTRAEFAAMLLRTRGMGSVGSTSLENPPFPDVTTPDVSWAIGNIRTARELGIINGYDDGTFKPNNNVSYEEAVTMIVRALGYGEMGSEGAFWYSKYIMTATSLGFLDGAGGAIATPATRATIASMLYNCLEVNLAEDNRITDKTILENDLKLTKNIGYISSSPTISLSQPNASLRSDEVEITTTDKNGNNVAVTYKVDDASKYNDMLGAQIEFYYQNDFNTGFKNLLLATVKNSTTLKIDANLMQNATSTAIKYLQDENSNREKTAAISANSVVVYNDKLYGTAADASSTFATYLVAEGLPVVGSIELLDRDGDSVYDVVFVNDYDVYFVSSVTSSDYKVTDNAIRNGMSNTDRQITLDYNTNDITFLTPDSNKTTFNTIKKGSVIFVSRNNHSLGDATVIVCNDTVSGKVTGTSSETGYTINGKTYKDSSLAPWKRVLSGASPTLTTAPQMGDSAKFYLDLEGNIIWYDKTETTSNLQYGYITGTNYDNGSFDEIAQVMIATKSNIKGSVYTITNKSKIIANGTPVATATLQDFVDELDKANDRTQSGLMDSDYRQLVKFTTSKGTEIDEIVVATGTTATPEKVADNVLNLYSPITYQTDCKYSTTASSFETTAASSAKKINVSKAFILDVRTPGKYSLLSTSKLKQASAGGYNVECFDVDSTNYAKVVLVHTIPVTANVGEVDENSPVFVVDEARPQADGDTVRYILSGWRGTQKYGDNPGEATPLKLSVEDANTVTYAPTLEKGDVVRLGTDGEGYYTIDNSATKQHVIFRMNPANYRSGLTKPCKEEGVTNNVAKYEVIWGSLYERSNTALLISMDRLTGTEAEGDFTLREDPIEPSAFSGAKILVYRMEDGDLKIYEEAAPTVNGDDTDWGYIERINKFTNQNGDVPAEVFIHMSSNKVKTMIIVER